MNMEQVLPTEPMSKFRQSQSEILELLDDGPGFPAEVLQNPCEPYVTSKRHGSGLGLAICRKIVLEHDGRISIANPPRGGAQVIIDLPLNPRAA